MYELFLAHMAFSLVLWLIVGLDWSMSKDIIEVNGWDLRLCTPVHETEIWMFFIPVLNLIHTYISMVLMARQVYYHNDGQTIDVYIWKFGFHYSEPIEHN